MTIGIVGGTGDFGQGLAARFRVLGEDFVIGSRTPRGDFLANDEASQRSEIVFLCVPPDGVDEMVQPRRSPRGRIVVSVASGLRLREGPLPRRSDGEAAPGARVVAGFHTVSAKALANPDVPLDEDVLLCGDDDEARSASARSPSGSSRAGGRLREAREPRGGSSR